MMHTLSVLVLVIALSLIVACKITATEDVASTTTRTTDHSDLSRTSTDDNTTVVNDVTGNVDTKDFDTFLMACSQGDIDTVKEFVQNDTSYYVTAYSKNGGESCLHVAGILGQATVTQYILQNGGNPNQRSQNIQHGLRMTPLSWNVYGNHIENVQLLLQAGADVNLDFDYVVDGTLQKVTVFDLLLYIHSNINFNDDNAMSDDETNSDHEESVYSKTARVMYDLLRRHGAQRYTDLVQPPNQMEKDAVTGSSNNQQLEL
jgi:ankyrin repeat protein